MNKEIAKNDDFPVISVYTRQDAINDGELIDVSETAEAKDAGFKAPIALTKSVMSLVEVQECLKGLQDFNGRLWDTLFLAVRAFRIAKAKNFQGYEHGDGCLIAFLIDYQMAYRRKTTYKLWLVFNTYEGFTIMKPEDY